MKSKHDVKIKYAALMITHTLLFAIKDDQNKLPVALDPNFARFVFCNKICIVPYLGLVLFVERVLEVAARSVGALRETRGECALRLGQFLGKRRREKNEQVKRGERRKKHETENQVAEG